MAGKCTRLDREIYKLIGITNLEIRKIVHLKPDDVTMAAEMGLEGP